MEQSEITKFYSNASHKYKDIPPEVFEDLCTKACWYDNIANTILSEDYNLSALRSENHSALSEMGEVIWHMIVAMLDGLEIRSAPYPEDITDKYITENNPRLICHT